MRIFKTPALNNIIITTNDIKTGYFYVGNNRWKMFSHNALESFHPSDNVEEESLDERSLYEGDSLNQLVRVYRLNYQQMVRDGNDNLLNRPIWGSVAVFQDETGKLVSIVETHFFSKLRDKYGEWYFPPVADRGEFEDELTTKIEVVHGKMTREKAMYLLRSALDWDKGDEILLSYTIMAE